jgi:hypothetical protein
VGTGLLNFFSPATKLHQQATFIDLGGGAKGVLNCNICVLVNIFNQFLHNF